MKINVLTDYRGWFCSSVLVYKQTGIVSMDIDKLKAYALDESLELYFIQYSEIDLKRDYSGQCFIYTSSEDPELKYKSYFEDVLYALHRKGAILLPEWRYMRAHHNKALMEMLRDVDLAEIDTGIHSRIFGCYEEFFQCIDEIRFPCVFKTAEGAGSKGVALFNDKEQAQKLLKELNINHKASLKEKLWLSIRRIKPSTIHSNYRNKFVIQNFIQGLSGDFKVLVFGDKYYALSRKNRDNDFRASGGGRLNYEPELPNGIFDFAKSVYDALNVPILSLDIAFDGNRFYLIEFQCLHFGTATLEYSTHYHCLENGKWVRRDEMSVLEKEFIHSLKNYLSKNFGLE